MRSRSSFEYPRHNFLQLPTKNELRRVVVNSIRDTLNEPLEDVTLSLNPLLDRGRWLVTGTDLDKELERSFYVESMHNIQPLSSDDLQPLKGAEYIVVEQTHVVFKATRLGDALAYRWKRQSGVICMSCFTQPDNWIL